jgi:hypothetical protein
MLDCFPGITQPETPPANMKEQFETEVWAIGRQVVEVSLFLLQAAIPEKHTLEDRSILNLFESKQQPGVAAALSTIRGGWGLIGFCGLAASRQPRNRG